MSDTILHVRIARLMRRWADRIDREHAPRATGYSFTFEPRRGVVFNRDVYGPTRPKETTDV